MVGEAIPMTGQITATLPDVGNFITRIRGAVLQPGQTGYDEARTVRNGLINRHPAIIVRCSGSADVVEAVNYAREHKLLLSVRGGAHNVAGKAVNDDGLVIDLSGMKGVYVDPVARTVRAQGGATWGDVDRETQLHGLATAGGVVSTTGIGGLTLHGGIGHLRRKHGLTIDNLLSVEIVTADGEVLRASTDENRDLFWAIRGAGPNFGVVTSFEFRVHPLGPEVTLAAPLYPLEDAPKVFRAWRDLMATMPDEVASLFLMWNVPDAEPFPPEIRRKPVVIPATVYSGPAEDGEGLLQPIREWATPLIDLSGPMRYTDLQAAFDPFFPVGRFYYWKSTYLDDLSDDAIDVLIERARVRPSPMSAVTFWQLGGAISRVGDDETAFGRRSAPYLFTAESTWDDPSRNEQNITWSRQSLEAVRRFSRGGLYLNFPGFNEEKEAQLRDAYGPNYDRLVRIKTKYDPGNLFRMNLNIPPAS